MYLFLYLYTYMVAVTVTWMSSEQLLGQRQTGITTAMITLTASLGMVGEAHLKSPLKLLENRGTMVQGVLRHYGTALWGASIGPPLCRETKVSTAASVNFYPTSGQREEDLGKEYLKYICIPEVRTAIRFFPGFLAIFILLSSNNNRDCKFLSLQSLS